MADHNGQQLSAREMVRAHTYPVLAAVASFSLLALALLDPPGGEDPPLQPLHRCPGEPAQR